MAKTLFDLTYELITTLGPVNEGVATGGSTTTIADTVERVETDDFWNGGAAWVLYDAGGLSAAPQGEFSHVTDFANTGGIITLRTTLSAAVASGDRYAIARTRYPLSLLIAKVNQALRQIPLHKEDITTITIAAEQTEYSLPTDLWDLKQVWVQSNPDDTNDTQPEQIFDWDIIKSATGTANKLRLQRQFATDTKLALKYLTYHQTLRAATDKLDDSIHSNLVVSKAVLDCLLWRKAKVGQLDENENQLLNFYQGEAAQLAAQFATTYPAKSAKTIHLSFSRP
jgi:hypothetical protein